MIKKKLAIKKVYISLKRAGEKHLNATQKVRVRRTAWWGRGMPPLRVFFGGDGALF